MSKLQHTFLAVCETLSGKTTEQMLDYLTAALYELARNNNLLTSKPTRMGWDVDDDDDVIGCVVVFGEEQRTIARAEFVQAIPQKDYDLFYSLWEWVRMLIRKDLAENKSYG